MKKRGILFLAAMMAVLMLCGMAAAESAEQKAESFVRNGVTFTAEDKYQYAVSGSATGYVNFDLVYSPKGIPEDIPVGFSHWVKFYADDPAITLKAYWIADSGRPVEMDLLETPTGLFFTIPFEAKGLILRVHIDPAYGLWGLDNAHCGLVLHGTNGQGFEELAGYSW